MPPIADLRRVRAELDQTLGRAEQVLRALGDTVPVGSAIDLAESLGEVGSVLESLAAGDSARVAAELEALVHLWPVLEEPRRARAGAALRSGISALRRHLGRIGAAGDVLTPLLAALDEIRVARGETLATESELFALDIPLPAPATLRPPAPVPDLPERLRALRYHYQRALLDWLAGNAAASALERMERVCTELESLTGDRAAGHVWRAAAAVTEALLEDGLEDGLAVRRLLTRVDRVIKATRESGGDDLGEAGGMGLLRALLYHAARAESEGARMTRARQLYRLEPLVMLLATPEPEPEADPGTRSAGSGPPPMGDETAAGDAPGDAGERPERDLSDVPLPAGLLDSLLQARGLLDRIQVPAPADDGGEPPTGAERASAPRAAPPAAAEVWDPELVEIYVDEVGELLAELDTPIAAWTIRTSDLSALSALGRAFHALKGSSRLVGAKELGDLAWSLERMVIRLRDGAATFDPAMLDLVREFHGRMPSLVQSFADGRPVQGEVAEMRARAGALSGLV